METPGSLANSAQAATLIQRAFRGAQRRIAAEQEDLAAILISMEEAEEARINARQSVMHTVNRTLEEFITSVEMKLRGGGEGEDTKRVLATKTLRKRELPTLTADSSRISSADSPTTSGSRWSTRSPSFRRRRCSS